MELELDSWDVPGDSRRGVHWGEGISFSPRGSDSPTVFFRFYEWNVFGFARDSIHSHADKSQAALLACHPNGGEAEITYPAHDVDLFATAATGAVDLSVRIRNRTGRDWPAVAGFVPCLNPGRDRRDDPITPAFYDASHEHSYFAGESGLENLEGRNRHLLTSATDAIDDHRPPGGFPDEAPWYEVSDRDAVDPVVIRESDDGEWVTGCGFEDALWVQGHNPWNCLHLCVRAGPIDAGEIAELRGRLYLQRGDREDLLERYRSDFS